MDYVIGNIEGKKKIFDKLLASVSFDERCDKLYILGDFIGNTFDSIKLVEDIIQKTRNKIYFPVLGDREEMFLEALERKNIQIEEKLLAEKGLIYSYYDNLKAKRSHMRFFNNLPKYIETDKYLFSHLGNTLFSDKKIISCNLNTPEIEKNDKLHFYSHFEVNKLSPTKLVYHNKNTNSLCVNKNVLDAINGALVIYNIQAKKAYAIKDTVL